MNFRRVSQDEPQMDESLKQTLKDYRSSVHAWSDAVYNQPHKPVRVYKTSWRVTASWALGCVLAVASVAGGLYERHHVKEQAKIAAAAQAARQAKHVAEQREESEDQLAKIDSDVSREVPSAMEPLAKMMVEDSTE
jgi:cytochrome c-type biogenesis protein CcmH/NrfG